MRKGFNIPLSVLLMVVGILMLFPIYLLWTGSLLKSSDLEYMDLGAIYYLPPSITMGQYHEVLIEQAQYVRSFQYSLLLSVCITGIRCLIGVLSGYVLAKVPFRGKSLIWAAYIAVLILPQQIILVPVFHICHLLKLNNTIWSLILPLSFSSLGPCVTGYLMRQIPDELCESARIDGASTFHLLADIVIPAAKPAILLLILISFAECWNLIEEPLILVTDRKLYPLSVLLSEKRGNSAEAWAGSFVFLIPALLLFIYVQDQELTENIALK